MMAMNASSHLFEKKELASFRYGAMEGEGTEVNILQRMEQHVIIVDTVKEEAGARSEG